MMLKLVPIAVEFVTDRVETVVIFPAFVDVETPVELLADRVETVTIAVELRNRTELLAIQSPHSLICCRVRW